MALNYILSYLGGCCGEWLCYQIAKDPNYYPIKLQIKTDANKWVIENPLNEFAVDIKSPYDSNSLSITDDQRELQDKKYNKKHFIIPTHYMHRLDGINLARLKGVRLHFTYLTAPFFYTLLWIKTWAHEHNLTEFDKQDILRCANGDSGDSILLKIDNVLDKADEIIKRNKFYGFEKSALRFGIRKSEDFVERFYGFYFRYCLHKPNDFIPLSVEKLMFNPAAQVKDWQRVFDMTEPLDADLITDYHQSNIEAIEKTFNMNYDTFVKSKWLLILRDWVVENCPNRY